MRKTLFARVGLLSWLVAGLLVSEVLAQGYPVKPIRLINGFSPGGSIDVMLRIVQPKFQESLGQPFVIDYRPGAGGIIGADIAAKAPPDGYTLLMFPTSYTVHHSIYKNLPYDLTKNFVPVTLVSRVADVLVVHPSVPARTVKEFIAVAKARPGRLNYASSSVGGTQHMAAELFNTMAGVSMTHITYKGTGVAITDLMGGHVDLMFSPIPVAEPHIRTGKLRALGVATATRAIAMPEVPTIAEAGLPGYEATNSVGVLAPAGTPREIVVRIQQEFTRLVKLPDVREQVIARGMEPVGSTPEQFADFIRTEIAKWAKVVKAINMPLQSL